MPPNLLNLCKDSFVTTNVAFDGFGGLLWMPAEIILIVRHSREGKIKDDVCMPQPEALQEDVLEMQYRDFSAFFSNYARKNYKIKPRPYFVFTLA